MFGGDGSSVYQLKQQARCLAALEGDTDHNKFLVATLELRAPNELHVLDFNEDTNEVRCERVYAHPHEAWCLASCPAPEHSELVMSVYSTGSELRTALWRMEGLAEAGGDEDGAAQPAGAPPAAGQLTELLQLGAPAPLGEVRGLLWNAVLPEQAATLQRSRLTLWQLSHGGAASSAAEGASAPPPGDDGATFGCGRWDPHHAHSLGVGCGGSLVSIDTRSMKPAHTVSDAHTQRVRGVDYNPNKPYVVLSCGDDYAIKFWDMRKPDRALHAIKAHAHWTTCALYNRFHDQLVLSAGTDYQVKLWRAASISSAPPVLDEAEPELAEADADGLVKAFDDHEQSVFAAAWSAADAWIFASLSADGKAVINHVPPAEKYKILL